MRAIAFCVALLAAVPVAAQRPPWETGHSNADDIALTLVTFGPGDEIVSLFGHSALIVQDRRLGSERLYNYGYFSFDRALLLKYAFGELQFWVADRPVESTLAAYERENRDIRLIELELSPAAALAAAQALAEAVKPENARYLYDHYTDNCSTRIRDVIQRASGGALDERGPGRMTLREHTRRYAAAQPAVAWLFDYLLGRAVDQPLSRWGEAFLPEELEAMVLAARVPDTRPLARSQVVRFTAARAPVPLSPPRPLPLALAVGVGLAGLLLVLAWRRRTRALAGLSLLVALPAGVVGVVLLLLSTITRHLVARANENLLLGPLLFLTVPLLCGALLRAADARRHRRLALLFALQAAAALLALAWKLLPVTQGNGAIVAFFVPVSLGLALSWRLTERASSGAALSTDAALHDQTG